MLGYRTFFTVETERQRVTDLAFEQLHSWLRSKRYDADALSEGSVVPLGSHAEGTLLTRRYQDGSLAARARVSEETPTGQWTTQLTVHSPARLDRAPWIWLDVEAPEQRWTATPRLARFLLDVFEARDGLSDLSSEPRQVEVDGVEQLLDVVCDPDRRGMVFLAGDAADPLEGWRQYVSGTLADTVGLAGAYVLTGAATERFNGLIGETHGVMPGTIRTYLPAVDPADPVDAVRHRILSTQRILRDDGRNARRLLGWRARERAVEAPLPQLAVRVDREFEAAIDELLIARLSPALKVPDTTPTPETAYDQAPPVDAAPSIDTQNEAHIVLTELLLEVTGFAEINLDTVAELARLARSGARTDSDQAALSGRLRELQKRNATLQDERTALIELLDDEREDHNNTEIERAKAEERTRRLQTLLVNQRRADEAWSEDIVNANVNPPESFEDLLVELKQLPHLVFTGDETVTLALDDHDPLGTWARKAWDALLALEDYAIARADGRSAGGVEAYLRHLPPGCHGFSVNRHARDESESVRSNPVMARHRMLPIPAEVGPDGLVFMGAHFKIAQSGTISPRLHYYDDTARTGHVYVGYLGRHLPTGQTN